MSTLHPQKKVLLAARPTDLQLVSDALGGEFDLIICHSVLEATTHLDENIGFIACGVRFDSGQMFELLKAAKANPNTEAVPFYLFLWEGKEYSDPILKGIRTAAKSLGATALSDLGRLENDLGRQKAHERLREVIRQALKP